MNKKAEIKEIRCFFFVHFLSIIVFAIINFFLMLEIDKHYLVNKSISKNVYKNNVFNALCYSAAIESTNGLSDIIPASIVSKSIASFQYVMTILITGYFLF